MVGGASGRRDKWKEGEVVGGQVVGGEIGRRDKKEGTSGRRG